MATSKIYYLHRGDDVPFYVGETSSKRTRLNKHKQVFGTDVEMKIIKETKNWRKWEKYFIEYYTNQGFVLENKNKGGGGVAKGTPKPEGFGEKLSKQRKGNWKVPTHQIEAATKAKLKRTNQYTLDGEFVTSYESSKLAAQAVGVHEVNMRAHLGGKYKTCKGFIFKYSSNV